MYLHALLHLYSVPCFHVQDIGALGIDTGRIPMLPRARHWSTGNRYRKDPSDGICVVMKKLASLVRFDDLTAVTMKNGVFWDIKTQFVLHRRHITSLLQSSAG
jgi:hypothetical protein